MHLPATRGSDLIEPPVVRRHVHVGAAEHKELAGLLIEYHGVSAGDALHQRASEFRLSVEERGKTDLAAGFIDQPCARAIERRSARIGPFQRIDRARQFVRVPHVILVAKGVVFANEIFRAGLKQEICGRPTPRAVDDLDLTGLTRFLQGKQNRLGAIAGAVVGSYQLPVFESLPFERSELLGQKTLTVERAKKNRNCWAGRRW